MEFNFVIKNEFWSKEMEDLLFQSDGTTVIEPTTDMFDILVTAGMFKSKSEARKNWKRTGKDIPRGFTDIHDIGKMKHRLTIWMPVEDKDNG